FPDPIPFEKNPPRTLHAPTHAIGSEREIGMIALADLEDHQGDVIELGAGTGEPEHILHNGGDDLPRRQVSCSHHDIRAPRYAVFLVATAPGFAHSVGVRHQYAPWVERYRRRVQVHR